MKENIPSTTNIVELQGQLVNNTLEVKTDRNGRKFISGVLEINTGGDGDECVVPVEFLQYELKKDGSRNAIYDRTLKMTEWPSVASSGNQNAVNVSISRGEIVDNSFYSERNQKIVENWRVRAVFVDQASRLAPRNNSFTIQGVIDNIKEIVDGEGEPTGELKIDLLCVGFGERIVRVPMYISNKEGKQYVEANWTPGDLVTTYGEIVYETRVTEIKQDTAFGKGNSKKFTSTVRKLVINSGTSPKAEGDHLYDRRKMLNLREASLKNIEEKALANSSIKATVGDSGNPFLQF